ncbi:hybrid sensor histidine kinase/response regulator transcription factor [Tellurirhabdus bombi]|uniref:hybrid sensor histidine kinase/response regulator transcription factor n=1 Tax=Tellurirhabdus bombi TaxID=2907205 RepID=UPI001F3A92CA|nr:two-component regulator propeller domain-containing protein [Tellurirhabdus bombi]
MFVRLACLCLLVNLFLAGFLAAQPRSYSFSHLGSNQNLSNNQINSILKDQQGFIWFGTLSGLNRYDGYTCKVFHHDIRDTTSLIDSYIERIDEGPGGFLWVFTRKGINIYDPSTERFIRNADRFARRLGLPDARIRSVKKDPKGAFWFLHATNGLYIYHAPNRQVGRLSHHAQDSSSLRANDITDINFDRQGAIWVAHQTGLLEKIDGSTKRVVYRNTQIHASCTERSSNFQLFVDQDNDVWISESRGTAGAFYLNPKTGLLHHVHKDAQRGKLNSNLVRNIVQDSRGFIWLGTDHGGINVLNKKDFSVRYLVHDENEDRSVIENTIYALYRDDTGIIWAGTFKKGVSFYHENSFRFPAYRRQSPSTPSLSFDDINRFVEDQKGNLWLGTNGGGLIYYDRKQEHFTTYRNRPGDPNSLSNDVIVSLCLDRAQRLWIGTYFGGLNRWEKGKFVRYRANSANPTSLVHDNVWDLLEDSRQNLWVGTLGGGLDQLDRATGQFKHHRPGSLPSIHSDYILTLLEDKSGNLWIGHDSGIDVWNQKTGQTRYYSADTPKNKGLSNNDIIALCEDHRGWIWIGTSEGLNLYDKRTDTFRTFRKEDGLPDHTVQSIVEDNDHNLWMGTPNGLSNLIITKNSQTGDYQFTFRNYDELDGLPAKSFNKYAAYKTRQGELVFGSLNGFTIFDPARLGTNLQAPKIVLTDFQVLERSIRPGDVLDGKILLNRSISETQELTLTPNQNVFSLEFAALNFLHPEKNTYQYKLEGFHDEWLTVSSKMRKATFTNLDPGTYTFRVRASNNDGYWNTEGTKLKITVLPPFWRSNIAFVLYALLIIGALLLARWIILERARLNFRMEQERQEAKRMHELDMMKIKFFTNVSHEFRTPLTLILNPLDRLVKETTDPEQARHFQLIQRNAKRLLNFVNQLLDFRRLEVQELKLYPTHNDLVAFCREIFYTFSDLSEKKNILFSFQTNVDDLEIYFDTDKMERILFNLLSNAFKFTPEHGRVILKINLLEQQPDDAQHWLEIAVQDSGIGIPSDKQEKIFERFFQHDIPGTIVNQGSGIGLAITKEFVRLHGGQIYVDSEPNHGSAFTVRLPIQREVAYPVIHPPVVEAIAGKTENKAEPMADTGKNGPKKPVVLLIDDNEDFRFYLKDNLRSQYTILEAANGKDGWHQILTHTPDLIVSDVMMPEMDGISLCRKVRADKRTSHTPVLLLTARSAEAQKLEGLETGANDYITKPFNFEILQVRIKNLISQRHLMEKSVQKHIEVSPSEIEITSLDEKLIQRALEVVEKNMANPDFSVEELSRELGMSRVHLYKKLLALTNRTPIEFIRTIRLQRAAKLLEKSQLTVAEIAYQVGFNNPKYFTKYFKQEFDTLPSAYVAEKRQVKVS